MDVITGGLAKYHLEMTYWVQKQINLQHAVITENRVPLFFTPNKKVKKRI